MKVRYEVVGEPFSSAILSFFMLSLTRSLPSALAKVKVKVKVKGKGKVKGHELRSRSGRVRAVV